MRGNLSLKADTLTKNTINIMQTIKCKIQGSIIHGSIIHGSIIHGSIIHGSIIQR